MEQGEGTRFVRAAVVQILEPRSGSWPASRWLGHLISGFAAVGEASNPCRGRTRDHEGFSAVLYHLADAANEVPAARRAVAHSGPRPYDRSVAREGVVP